MLRASGVRNGGRASTGVYQSDARDEGARRRVEVSSGPAGMGTRCVVVIGRLRTM